MAKLIKGAAPIFIDKKSKVGILMLHGFTSTPHEFKEISVFLSKKGFTVYAPLIAGHGTSPKDLIDTSPADWLLSAKDAYIKLKEKCEKVFIIGNSFGSNLAFWLVKELKNEPIGVVTLDAPIFLRNHLFILFRTYTYGWFKKYYRKARRVYRTDYIDTMDDVTYPAIPMKSLREFLQFIKKETIPNLHHVKVPVLVTHSKIDPVIHPKSATYIFENINSLFKKKYWFLSNYHAFTVEGRRKEVFEKIMDFLEEVIEINLNNKIIPKLFFETAKKVPNKTALLYKKEGVYFPITYKELVKKVKMFGFKLQKLGIRKGDSVVILSDNRPEWVISDLATMLIGGVVVPLHTTFSPDAIYKILNHCEAKVIIISNSNLLNKVLLNYEKLEFLKKIIFLDKLTDLQKENLGNSVISWKKMFSKTNSYLYSRTGKNLDLRPSDCASIIYTSGTTGQPKGVILTHRNFLSNIEAINKSIPVKKDDIFLSFLPLSHVLERTGGYYMPLFFGATIAYVEHIKQMPQNLKEVAPTILISVPRIFEKFHDTIWDTVNASSLLKKKLFHWALRQKEHTLGHKIANSLVFKKIRQGLGGNLRLAVSGGASLNSTMGRFFLKIGIPIFEGYGLTETSPVISLNNEKHFEYGTVGKIISGVEVKISQEKEILVKGPNVFKEYHKDQEATSLAFDKDGWFHTGDLGFINSHGFLTVIGRKKEMIVLSNGKKAWPEQIENALNNDKYIAQSIALGNHQNFVSALIVPDWQEVQNYLNKNNLPLQSPEKLIKNPQIISLFQKRLNEKINPELSEVEKVKKFSLLPQEFAQERGELTPTLKLRRHIIDSHYKKLIESLYS